MNKKIIGWLSLFVLLVVGSGCSIWGSSDTTQTTQTDQSQNQNPPKTEEVITDYYRVINPDQVLDQAKKRYAKASELAQLWQDDAKLLLVSVKYYASLQDTGVSDRFLFSSDKSADTYLAVDISREDANKYSRSMIFKSDYVLKSGVKPIPLKYWKTTSAQVLEKADSLGGADFRKKHANFLVTQVMSLAGGKNLAWYIVYSANGSSDTFEKIIDASSLEEIQN